MREFYDICLRSSSAETLEYAKKLGFSGVGVVLPYEKDVFDSFKGFPKDVARGIEIQKNIRNKAKDIRKNIELIASCGREAVETTEVDIAFCEELNYIMVKLAKKNNVAIAFSFFPVLHSSKRGREEILSRYFHAASLVRKYKAPFILTSEAKSKWDLRSPSDLIAFGKVLGFPEDDCIKALSGSIIKENRKRLKKEWIMPGVEKVSK